MMMTPYTPKYEREAETDVCRHGFPLFVFMSLSFLTNVYFANVRVKPNCMNGQD